MMVECFMRSNIIQGMWGVDWWFLYQEAAKCYRRNSPSKYGEEMPLNNNVYEKTEKNIFFTCK